MTSSLTRIAAKVTRAASGHAPQPLLSSLATKVAAAAPGGGPPPRRSLSSIVAAVERAQPARAQGSTPPARPIVLVACSDSKIETHGRAVPAAELYASPLFRKSLAHARAITSEDRIRILSARHGLLRTTDRIATYDAPIQKMSERERDDWGERVHRHLGRQFGWMPQDVIILAGAEYVTALRGLNNRYRTDRLPWTIELPFGAKKGERMSIGERLHWLNEQAYERGEAPRAREASPGRAAVAATRPASLLPSGGATRTSLVSIAASVTAAAPSPPVSALRTAPIAGAAGKSLALIAAAVAAAPTSARVDASVRIGRRIRFLGDTANPPSDGTITSVDGAYFSARLDNGQPLFRQPLALLSTPRWRVLGEAPLSSGTSAENGVASVQSTRAPGSAERKDLNKESSRPSTQRAPTSTTPPALAFLTGDRVGFILGPHAGRKGVVDRVCAGQFADHRYVVLDKGPRERTEKRLFTPISDLFPLGDPRLQAHPGPSAAKGILTAFREALSGTLARGSGTPDPETPPGNALVRILRLGRAAEEAGELWKSSAQVVGWSLAMRAALKGDGNRAAFHAGQALAVSTWRDRGKALLAELEGESESASDTAPAREFRARKRGEMEAMLLRGGYDPADAARLQAEGIGPVELEWRLRFRPEEVGSLHDTHGLLPIKGMAPSHTLDTTAVDQGTPAPDAPARKDTKSPARPAPTEAPRTFAEVRRMLLTGLSDRGWLVKPHLKVPWAAKGDYRLWFKPQAIYYGAGYTDARSLSSDMRAYRTVDDLLRDVERHPLEDGSVPSRGAVPSPPDVSLRHPGPTSAARLAHDEGPAAQTAQTDEQHPRIDSIKALLTLPIGTMLRLRRTGEGVTSSKRELVSKGPGNELRFRIADPLDREHNKIVHQPLTAATLVEPRANGFALLRRDHDPETPPWLEAEYVFDAEGNPASLGTWRAAFARHEEAKAAKEREARVEDTLEWLRAARIAYQSADTPAAEAKAYRDLEDAEAMHHATSLRELDPRRLERLIEATRDADTYEALHAALVEAHERGAYGAASAQFALFQREAAEIGTALDRLGSGRLDPVRERIRKAIVMVRQAWGFDKLTAAKEALREALEARRTARAAKSPRLPPAEQTAAAALEHRAEVLSQRLEEAHAAALASSASPPPAQAIAPVPSNERTAADDEAAPPSSRSWARAAALHDAEAMVRQMGPGFEARVGDVRVRATPDWKPPKARGQAPKKTETGDSEADHTPFAPVEHRTAAKRRDANIKAMWLAADLEAHPRPLTDEDRLTLAAYSDWGGLEIEKVLGKFPPGFPVPEARQLIHAYFTPPAVCAEIARVIRPLLPGLVSTDGQVHALEPAVGIGRFPLALSGPGFETVIWHCVEYSELSYKMLRALRPDMDLYHGPFEAWVAAHGEDFAGRLKLIISNPPYGERSFAMTDDPDRRYRYNRADHYFLRRGLDLLGQGGLGVYIIPSGFLTGMADHAIAFRREVLLRHHLSAAIRLPNEVFSLANVVTDILFFRARGTILPEVDEADTFILNGRYYDEFPAHILGEVVVNAPGKKRGWHTSAGGYTVVGAFTALPPVLEERPMCAACQHTRAPALPPEMAMTKATPAALISDDERMAAAVSLGRRVETFLTSVSNPDLEPVGWEELRHDLEQWAALHGPPSLDQDVLALASAERGPSGKGPPGGAGWLLKAFLGKSATLIEPLAHKPRWMPRFLGNPNDPLQWGEYLYRTRKTLSIDEFPGKDPNALFAAGWCEDSTAPAWTERLEVRGQLLPPDEYLFGELWPKFDRAQARAALGDAQAAAQAARLLEIIKPATFDEIEVTPQDGFVPLDVLAAWLTTMNYGDPVALEREKGLVRLANVAYEDHDKGLSSLSQEALWILGWVNHDYVVFQPSGDDAVKVDERRLEIAKEWTQRFRAWLEADPARQRVVEHHYQRARQGYRAHDYGAAPLKLARWNPAIVLNPHQVAGARRLDANRGGGLGFDVGVGKTFTILAALALARQTGRARRPVIVVPQPIAFQWVQNVAKALPDFRVVVIGINKKTIAHGLRKGVETSETDSPEERSRKWARFQGGEFDVAILTYDALPRTQMDKESTLRFIAGVTAIEREIEIRRRNALKEQKGKQKKYLEEKEKLEKKLQKAVAQEEMRRRYPGAKKKGDPAEIRAQLAALEEKHKKRPLTERQDAILAEGVGAWLAEMLELPPAWKPDPDIVWNKIGVDWLAFDEGHNGKNLHMPSSREGGTVPKFMGNEGEGSKRAWHWFFRCCDVQSRGGEVIVATATPASNSPVEFYNLIKYMDKEAWTRIGIHDPEAFIDRFCLLEPQEVLGADMATETRLACVGFKNLDELRSVVFKYWEFKTAKQANLKLPVAKVERVFVDMDTAQERKYERYIEEIEDALERPREGSHKILGLLARMAMVAMHSQLDEKFEWSDAHLVSSPHSPKFDALAKKILAQRGCGHIVFADYVAAHAWIRDVLIEAGIPASRIGILNAIVAPNAADRQRIARDFNGNAREGIPSKYDVLIANAIGEEGVDLQDKTCAIHHLDIGWTPKKTEQRNGRGVRQGNTLSNINIFYYIANRSQDGTRLDMVRGKQNWISSLLEGEDKDTNNPAAQSTLSRKDLLVLISRDPEKTRARLEAAEAEREKERREKVAKAASDTLRAAANRFERARTERDPTVAAEYISVAKQKIAGLAKVPPDIWPWAGWATAAEHAPMLVPKEGGPVYEGLRVAMPRVLDRSVIEYAEFGRIDNATIGTRVAGAAHWEESDLDKVVQLRLEPQMRIAEGSGNAWPVDDQAGIDKAIEDKWLHRFRHGAGAADAWRDLGWVRAPDAFVEAQWARWGDVIAQAMASTGGWAANLQVPAIRGGRLVLGLTPPYEAVVPPTLAGWHRFLELAPRVGEKFTALENAGRWWFGRTIPRNLLVAEGAPLSAAA